MGAEPGREQRKGSRARAGGGQRGPGQKKEPVGRVCVGVLDSL